MCVDEWFRGVGEGSLRGREVWVVCGWVGGRGEGFDRG